MENNFVDFYEKFQVNENTIYKTEYWTLSLRPFQATIGSCIISLNRYCEKLSDITCDESTDLQAIVKFTEDALSKAFQYNKINYLMLMMVDPHLHYHVIPRYSEVIKFNGQDWKDIHWPGLPDLGGLKIDEEISMALIQELAGNNN